MEDCLRLKWAPTHQITDNKPIMGLTRKTGLQRLQTLLQRLQPHSEGSGSQPTALVPVSKVPNIESRHYGDSPSPKFATIIHRLVIPSIPCILKNKTTFRINLPLCFFKMRWLRPHAAFLKDAQSIFELFQRWQGTAFEKNNNKETPSF